MDPELVGGDHQFERAHIFSSRAAVNHRRAQLYTLEPKRWRNCPKSKASTAPPPSKSKVALFVPNAWRNAPKSTASTLPLPSASPNSRNNLLVVVLPMSV